LLLCQHRSIDTLRSNPKSSQERLPPCRKCASNTAFRTGVKNHLNTWYAEVEKAAGKDPAELEAQFRSASIVSGERVVLNSKGDDYRLVVAINFHYQILLIIWLGTHKEYDKIDVTKVAYEKERYADSSNSN
jgi:mRNA interferase HigB